MQGREDRGGLDATRAASFVRVADVQLGSTRRGDRASSRTLEYQDHRGGLQARAAACPDHGSRGHGQAVPKLIGPCARHTEAANEIWSQSVISRPIATEPVTVRVVLAGGQDNLVAQGARGWMFCHVAPIRMPCSRSLACWPRRPHLPNSGRCIYRLGRGNC